MKRSYKALKPGWKMTESQWLVMWRKWGDVCRAQGWDKLPAAERDAKRREILAELGFTSAKEIDKGKGCDAVFRRFDELANVISAPVDGEKKRLLHRIGEVAAELSEQGFPEHRFQAILKSNGVVAGVRDIAELDKVRLTALSAALTGILAEWERETVAPTAEQRLQ